MNDCIKAYWNGQADGFTKISLYELNSSAYEIWRGRLEEQLSPAGLNILDVGCGAGFFGIVLSRLGAIVTETDFSEDMLEQAKLNLNEHGKAENATFILADAHSLPFADGSFDAVVSRNISWVLKQPDKAYAEWLRVLKPGGKLLNFDGNWFLHRFDAQAMKEYEKGAQLVRKAGFQLVNSDHSQEVDKEINAMPMTARRRPEWDRIFLQKQGCEVEIDQAMPVEIYDEYYRRQYRYIPTFMISATKRREYKGN